MVYKNISYPSLLPPRRSVREAVQTLRLRGDPHSTLSLGKVKISDPICTQAKVQSQFMASSIQLDPV